MNSQLDAQLIKACQRGDLIAVRRMVQLGANINHSSVPSFIHAYRHGHIDIVLYLLEHEADLDHDQSEQGTLLAMASYEGDSTFAEQLLSLGANVNHPLPLGGETSLFLAINQNHFETTKLLINHGANVKHCAKISVNSKLESFDYFWGETPLHIAAVCADLNIIELLLSSGADREAETSKNQTPFDYAQQSNRPHPILKILEEGKR